MWKLCLALFILATSVPLQAEAVEQAGRYFPEGLLHAQWTEFPARGYSRPVTGVIYRGRPRPTCGMPLGGIDTGCIDIEPNGMLGYSTIFNHLINPRSIGNVPLAAISVDGKTCLLATDTKGKRFRPLFGETGTWPPFDYTPAYFDIELKDVALADSIDYWGHYPIVDMEFDTQLPVSIGMRAWSPFLPGDTVTSMMPGAVFEFSLRNPTNISRRVTLVFNFPGFDCPPRKDGVLHTRRKLTGAMQGVSISTTAKGDSKEMGYTLVALDRGSVRTGGSLGTNGSAWNQVEQRLPDETQEDSGTTLAVDLELEPGQSVTRRIVLAWHAPCWNASGAPGTEQTRKFTHMYASHYPDAEAIAHRLAADHESLLRRVIAWQAEIYDTKDIPGWLADSLINSLYVITETSVWGQGTGSLDQFGSQYGLFGLNECPRGCAARMHPVRLLRQHTARLLLPRHGPFDIAGLQGVSVSRRPTAVDIRRRDRR